MCFGSKSDDDRVIIRRYPDRKYADRRSRESCRQPVPEKVVYRSVSRTRRSTSRPRPSYDDRRVQYDSPRTSSSQRVVYKERSSRAVY